MTFGLGGVMSLARISFLLFVATLTTLMPSSVAFAQDKGRLGVEIEDLTKEEADKLGVPQGSGARVKKVIEGGPAATAGLLPDDIILSLDGLDVAGAKDLIASVQARSPGEQLLLRVSRGGSER